MNGDLDVHDHEAVQASGFAAYATRYGGEPGRHAALLRLWIDQQYDLRENEAILDAVVAGARAAHDVRGLLWGLLTRALFTYRERPLERCWADHRDASALAAEVADARADRLLGICEASLYLHGGQLEEADRRFHAMPLLGTSALPDADDCYVLHCRAVCAMAAGWLEDSFQANYANVQLADSIRSPVRRGLAAAHLAGCLLVIGSAEESIGLLEPLLDGTLSPERHAYVWSIALSNLAEAYRMTGQTERAYVEFRKLLDQGLVERFPRFAFNLFDNLLTLALSLGHLAEADHYLAEAWSHARRSAHGSHLGACHFHAASIALSRGDDAVALHDLEQASRHFDGDQGLLVIDDTRDNVYRLLADGCCRAGNFQRAYEVQKAYFDAHVKRSAYTARGQLAALQVRHRLTIALREMAAERESSRTRERQLRLQASSDGLTGLFNRRYLDDVLPRLVDRALADGRPLSVALIDLDLFKAVNDRYGHATGDAVLRAFADVAGRSLRADDVACRYGGEEFCIVLPNCARADATALLERLLAIYLETTVTEGPNSLGDLSFSCGLAVFPDDGDDAGTLLAASDACLYRAKRAGRRQVLGT